MRSSLVTSLTLTSVRLEGAALDLILISSFRLFQGFSIPSLLCFDGSCVQDLIARCSFGCHLDWHVLRLSGHLWPKGAPLDLLHPRLRPSLFFLCLALTV